MTLPIINFLCQVLVFANKHGFCATYIPQVTFFRATHHEPVARNNRTKEATDESPSQYLKRIRLTKAKNLVVYRNKPAYLAVLEGGYELSELDECRSTTLSLSLE